MITFMTAISPMTAIPLSQTSKLMMTIKKSRSKLINTTSPPDIQHPNPSSVSCNGQKPVPSQDGKNTLRRECEPRFLDHSSRWLALSPSYNICNKFHPLYLFKRCNKKYMQSPLGDWKLKFLTLTVSNHGMKTEWRQKKLTLCSSGCMYLLRRDNKWSELSITPKLCHVQYQRCIDWSFEISKDFQVSWCTSSKWIFHAKLF